MLSIFRVVFLGIFLSWPISIQASAGSEPNAQVRQSLQEIIGKFNCKSIVDVPCCLNSTQKTVPQADLIFCRDYLVNLSFADIASALFLCKKSGSRYLLTTTFTGHFENRDSQTGGFRPLNLMAPPFNFPKPLAIINENCTEHGGSYGEKCLALWSLDDIPLLNPHLLLKNPLTVITKPIEQFNPDPWEHPAVTRSIRRGLEKIGFKIKFNPPKVSEVYENVIVLNNFTALKQACEWKKQGKIKKLLVGPNLTIRGVEAQLAAEIDYCITPSEWIKKAQIEDEPKLAGRIKIWPSGVDSTFWMPDEGVVKGNNVLVYLKEQPQEFCLAVESILRINGWNPVRIVYGSYTVEEYKSALKKCAFAVFLSKCETQGLALAEAWSMNVPTLVWEAKVFFDWGRWYMEASSCPYLNNQLGADWGDLIDLQILLKKIHGKLPSYAPRKWVLKNMSDEISAYDLIRIFQQS